MAESIRRRRLASRRYACRRAPADRPTHPLLSGRCPVPLRPVGPTAIAYTLYFRGLRTVAAGTAAVIMVVEPLMGAGLAALVLHDRLGLAGGAGAVLLAVAVVLASTSPGRS